MKNNDKSKHNPTTNSQTGTRQDADQKNSHGKPDAAAATADSKATNKPGDDDHAPAKTAGSRGTTGK